MKENELLINGGMAHSNAVSFYGKNYQSKATRDKNGEITVEIKKQKPLPGWVHSGLQIPLLRGFADTIFAFYMTWWIGLFFLIAPFVMVYRMPIVIETITTEAKNDSFLSGMIVGLAMVIIMLKVTAKGKYHAAEHVLHNLYLQNRSLTIEEGKKTTRIHEWCGSSCTILLIIYAIIMAYIPMPMWLKIFIWFPFYGEVIMSQNKYVRSVVMPFKWAGYAFQLLTTSKPKEEHLEVSRQAFQSLLEKEEALLKANKTA
ncbi:DUF1385 domain-containing protein [Cytobacillus sp. FJAT-54145]|uniref:DUF1385 domain-containing protein n=1 Tax=Cytobacillus spartinae TaxID=3299023 RepID=A0ABW6KDJ3_9BACI